jgi:hypothetical protein
MTDAVFYELLYNTLRSKMPKDSRNMVMNTRFDDFGDYFVITISGPTDGGYDYAEAVNAKKTPNKGGANPGQINYQWIEKTIKYITELTGGDVKYELS